MVFNKSIWLLPIFGLLITPTLLAQKNCAEVYKLAENAYKKGLYAKANSILDDVEACDPFNKLYLQRRELRIIVNKAIEKQRIDAENAKQEAILQKEIAEKQKLTTIANEYGNKAEDLLKDGDLTRAFRLSEFAYTYVDSTNKKVKEVLNASIYYNDIAVKNQRKYLHWYSSITDVESNNQKIVYSSKGDLIAITNDGFFLSEGVAKMWDANSRQFLYTIDQSYTYKQVEFSLDGKYLGILTSDDFQLVKSTSHSTFETLISERQKYSSFCFSPDSKSILLVTESGDVNIRPITPKLDDFSEYPVAYEAEAPIEQARFLNSDGIVILTSETNELFLVDSLTKSTKLNISNPEKIKQFKVFNNNKYLVVVLENSFCFYDINNRTTIDLKLGANLKKIKDLEISSDSKYIAISDTIEGIFVWNIASDFKLQLISNIREDKPDQISFSPDGLFIASSNNKIWKIFPDFFIKDELNINIFEGARRENNSIEFYSVSNQNFAIAYNDSLVNIWTKNIPQPYPLKLSSQPKELLFSQKSNYLLIVNNDSTLDILNIFQKQKIFHKSFTHDLKKAAFSADEDKLILAFVNGQVEIINLTTLKKERQLVSTNDFDKLHDIKYSKDGKLLGLAFGDIGVEIWDLTSNTVRYKLHYGNDYVTSIDFSKDNKYLISSNSFSMEFGGGARIWNLRDGVMAKTIEGYWDIVKFSDSGTAFSLATEDGKIEIYNFPSMENRHSFFEPSGIKSILSLQKDGDEVSVISKLHSRKWEFKFSERLEEINEKKYVGVLTSNDLTTLGVMDLFESTGKDWLLLVKHSNEAQLLELKNFYLFKSEKSNYAKDINENFGRVLEILTTLSSRYGKSYASDIASIYDKWAQKSLFGSDFKTALSKAHQAFRIDSSNIAYRYSYTRALMAGGYVEEGLKHLFEIYSKYERVFRYLSNWHYYPSFNISKSWAEGFEMSIRLFLANELQEDEDLTVNIFKSRYITPKYNSISYQELLKNLKDRNLAVKIELLNYYDNTIKNDEKITHRIDSFCSYYIPLFENTYLKSSTTYKDLILNSDIVLDIVSPYELDKNYNSRTKIGESVLGMNISRNLFSRSDNATIERLIDFAEKFILDSLNQSAAKNDALECMISLFEKLIAFEKKPSYIYLLYRLYAKKKIDFFAQTFDLNKVEADELFEYLIYFLSDQKESPSNDYSKIFLIAERMMFENIQYSKRKRIGDLCNEIGWNYLKKGEFLSCEKFIRLGLKADPSNIMLYTNLPPSILLQGRFNEAKEMYIKWKNKPYNINKYPLFKNVFLGDLYKINIPEERRLEVEEIQKILVNE